MRVKGKPLPVTPLCLSLFDQVFPKLSLGQELVFLRLASFFVLHIGLLNLDLILLVYYIANSLVADNLTI
jgi:hypothetical protein